jgi:hypothetical protein
VQYHEGRYVHDPSGGYKGRGGVMEVLKRIQVLPDLREVEKRT